MRRQGLGSFLQKFNSKLAGCGLSMMRRKVCFGSGVLRTNKLWWHRMFYTRLDLFMALPATKQSWFLISRKVQPIFLQRNGMELTLEKIQLQLLGHPNHCFLNLRKMRMKFYSERRQATMMTRELYEMSEETLLKKLEKELMWRETLTDFPFTLIAFQCWNKFQWY